MAAAIAFKWEKYGRQKFRMSFVVFLPVTILFTIFCWCTPSIVVDCKSSVGREIVDCVHKRNTGQTALFMMWVANFFFVIKEVRIGEPRSNFTHTHKHKRVEARRLLCFHFHV